jgi:hypothetical protein
VPDQKALVPADVDQGNNPLAGTVVNGKTYLTPRKLPGHVVCIACGMNVSMSGIDNHFIAHKAHRDNTLPQHMQRIHDELEAGDY